MMKKELEYLQYIEKELATCQYDEGVGVNLHILKNEVVNIIELVKNHIELSDVTETKGQLAILMIETEKKIADIREGGLGDNDDALIDSLIGKYEKYEEEYSSL